jgi:hypothetical protein
LGSDNVVSDGRFRKEGSSRGLDGSDGPFPLGVRTEAVFSSRDLRTFVSVSIAASKYGLSALVRIGSGTVPSRDLDVSRDERGSNHVRSRRNVLKIDATA